MTTSSWSLKSEPAGSALRRRARTCRTRSICLRFSWFLLFVSEPVPPRCLRISPGRLAPRRLRDRASVRAAGAFSENPRGPNRPSARKHVRVNLRNAPDGALRLSGVNSAPSYPDGYARWKPRPDSRQQDRSLAAARRPTRGSTRPVFAERRQRHSRPADVGPRGTRVRAGAAGAGTETKTRLNRGARVASCCGGGPGASGLSRHDSTRDKHATKSFIARVGGPARRAKTCVRVGAFASGTTATA